MNRIIVIIIIILLILVIKKHSYKKNKFFEHFNDDTDTILNLVMYDSNNEHDKQMKNELEKHYNNNVNIVTYFVTYSETIKLCIGLQIMVTYNLNINNYVYLIQEVFHFENIIYFVLL